METPTSKHVFLKLAIVITAIFIFFACSKDDFAIEEQTQLVQFSFSQEVIESDKGGRTNEDLGTPSSAIVTVANSDGDVILNRRELALHQFGDSFLSEPVTLTVGSYSLDDFLILEEETVIYVSPIEGSDKAYLVDDPLSIEFEVVADEITTLAPEVLAIGEDANAAEYGYGQFGFEVVETVDLVVSVFVKGEANFELTDASISIEGLNESGESVWNYATELGAEPNQLELRSAYNHTIVVAKEGYEPSEQQISFDTLNQIVLEIILHRPEQAQCDELLKYYGGSENDVFCAVAHTNDGYILGGRSRSTDGDFSENNGGYDYLIMKVDECGSIVWRRNFGGDRNEVMRDMLVTKNGNIIQVGTTASNAGTGDVTSKISNNDTWVVMSDAEGNLLWEKSVDVYFPTRVIETTDGNFIVANYDGKLLKITSGGEVLWIRDYRNITIKDVVELTDQKLMIVGHTGGYPNVSPWIVRTDSDGYITKEFESVHKDEGRDDDVITGALNVLPGGENDTYLISGYKSGEREYEVFLMSGDDEILSYLDIPAVNKISRIAKMGDDYVILAGLPSHGKWFGVYDANGIFKKEYNHSNVGVAYGIHTLDDEVVISGFFGGNEDNKGGYDGFLLKQTIK
ncbi:MAG: hypothetical protein ABJG47_07640 [Ekhidna sp.]